MFFWGFMKKSYEDVYAEVVKYIGGKNHNKPCMLQSIKKEFRTSEIIRLIFNNPQIFDLDAEFLHIPKECLTEELVMEFVLRNPKRLSLIDDGHKREIIIPDDMQTFPVLVAFECSKRRYEYQSRKSWGSCYEVVRYSAKTEKYKYAITNCCLNINQELLKKYSNGILDASIYELIEIIKKHCNDKEFSLEDEYVQKYKHVNLKCDKKIMILVSGAPDSGKSTFSRILSGVIGAIKFSSDFLLEKRLLLSPLNNLVNDCNCIIFSDTNAYQFFDKNELADYEVINIVIKASSNRELHTHSKYNINLGFEEHINNEVNKFRYDQLQNPIVVVNDYTLNILKEVDKAVEQIINRLKTYKDDQLEEKNYSMCIGSQNN